MCVWGGYGCVEGGKEEKGGAGGGRGRRVVERRSTGVARVAPWGPLVANSGHLSVIAPSAICLIEFLLLFLLHPDHVWISSMELWIEQSPPWKVEWRLVEWSLEWTAPEDGHQ